MTFAADLRSGIRALRTYPTLSTVAIVTLGLGIGLSTTVFCVVNGALFKGLPFEEPDRVVVAVWHQAVRARHLPPDPRSGPAVSGSRDRRRSTSLAHTASTSVNLSSDEGRPERVSAGQLSVAAFQTLRSSPCLDAGSSPATISRARRR